MLFVYLQFPIITFLSMIVTSYNDDWRNIQFLPEDGDGPGASSWVEPSGDRGWAGAISSGNKIILAKQWSKETANNTKNTFKNTMYINDM